ncbi:MAG: amino acid ABC transporter substrate-binding protein [Candidatus Latescibacteria bacterium]|nr:amino acid ABC transporter substrate-binding protein [Candidatus Latescibacterota bacterium]
MKPIKIRSLILALAGFAIAGPGQAGTLDDVRARGHLQCGINTGLAGFAFTDDQGNWRGFDVALCEGVAAAVFGDASKVKYTNLTGKTRFEALKAGEIDILSRNTTWTYSRDVDLKLTFLGVSFYDGQGFMVPASLGVSSATELDGASVCIQTGTTTELNLADFFRRNEMKYEPVPIESNEEARQNYLSGRCDVYTTDRSGLAATRAAFDNPDDHVVLPEIVSKEPLGPLVRHGDDEWGDVVRWVLNVLIIAEEKGITSDNVAEMARLVSKDAEISRMLGSEGEYGAMLGLSADWVVNVISSVGNYGQIFEQYLGSNTDIGLERGVNALWTDGGLLYAPPYR